MSGRHILAFAAAICCADAARAEMATCRPLGADNNVFRFKCDFGLTPGPSTFKIEYVSGECVSTAYGTFSVKQFQLVTTPPPRRQGAPLAPVQYQLAVNKTAINSGFVTGSYTFGATQTSIYSLPNTPVYALVDVVTPLPGDPIGRHVEQCTVSLAGSPSQSPVSP